MTSSLYKMEKLNYANKAFINYNPPALDIKNRRKHYNKN